uniref:Uncharacterized protein n=1 Tax=viral metagenome TaxID=1070528 RepID=A0A6M3IIB5_9ZZZZ
MINKIQNQLDMIGKVLPDLLCDATMTDLLGLNVSTFGLYSAIYGEIRMRLYMRSWAEQEDVIEKRIHFMKSEG